MIGVAGNKSDLFEQEEVTEEEAKNFSKEAGAIFRYTSAKESIGINELFISLGCKYLDPNFVDDESKIPMTDLPGIDYNKVGGSTNRSRGQSVKLNKDKIKEKKKKFC